MGETEQRAGRGSGKKRKIEGWVEWREVFKNNSGRVKREEREGRNGERKRRRERRKSRVK